MSESTIIFGFPGVGKSYAYNHQEELGLVLQDSDSSHFHWVYPSSDTEFKNPITDENGKKIPHPAWPRNYAQYIELTGREQEKNPDYILVSTHEEVMNTIGGLNFRSLVVVPDNSEETKAYFLNLYKERGNDDAFIEMMDKNWSEFLKDTVMRGMSNMDSESFVVLVGPNRPFKNIYDILKFGPDKLFPMEFDKEVNDG